MADVPITVRITVRAAPDARLLTVASINESNGPGHRHRGPVAFVGPMLPP